MKNWIVGQAFLPAAAFQAALVEQALPPVIPIERR
jgi:hypothetical protein